MANSDVSTRERPPSPNLVAPRQAAVVNGREVTFNWEPVEEADAYRLQVAATSAFDEILFEETLDDVTAVTVARLFPTDGQTFFWRVQARVDDVWSRGERVESLVATTEDEAEEHEGLPSDEEDMGPAAQLVRSAGRDVAETVVDVPRSRRLEREKEMGVAYEGVAAGQIAAIALSILFVIVCASIIVFFWTGQVSDRAEQAVAADGRNADLRETEIQATQQLEQYGVVSEEEGTYRIPIDRAMDIIANEAYTQEQQNAGEQQ
jgi:hypothetical protein